MKLKKTLYGLCQSPHAFWKYFVEKMAICGMVQSILDPCLFVGEKVICISYVDNLIFWACDEKDIHHIAMKLREVGVSLEQETDAAGFLGIPATATSSLRAPGALPLTCIFNQTFPI